MLRTLPTTFGALGALLGCIHRGTAAALRVVPVIDRHRARRVGGLLAVLWVLSLADLCLTLWAHEYTHFVEANPIADALLDFGLIPSLILYKVVLTAVGSLIFWRLRAYCRAEVALCGVVGVYVWLTFRWLTYTQQAMATPML